MNGQWSNWGRLKQGWSLEIGNAYRCSVVRTYPESGGVPEAWRATVNNGFLGDFPDAEVAKMRVEESVALDMKATLRDWKEFVAARPALQKRFQDSC